MRRSSGFIAGIAAGITAGLLLPKLIRDIIVWARTPAGKKALSEWIPPEDQKQITSMWNQRQELWNDGVRGLKKRWDLYIMSKMQPESAEDSSSESVSEAGESSPPKRTPRKSAAKSTKKTE